MTGPLSDKLFDLPEMEETTPMMRQYLEIKAQYQDAILFFRLGDFYEMFYQDAEVAARELDLTLTGRGKKDTGKRMPMCGIPFHAADNYILRLINKGFKVAICEQVEDPALAKGLTKREVIKVITPGTVIDEKLLPTASANYLAAVLKSDLKEDLFGIAFVDVSTGLFRITQLHGYEHVRSELGRIEPAELLTNDERFAHGGIPLTVVVAPALERAKNLIAEQFAVHPLTEHQLQEFAVGCSAAAALIVYLKATQKKDLKQLTGLSVYVPDQYMHLDGASRKNLELTQTIRTQSREGSLYGLLDTTKTAMGSRVLKEWINYPLLDKQKIEQRLDAVEELVQDLVTRQEISEFLKDVYDIERLGGRIASGNANARDLVFLKESLQIILQMLPTLSHCSSVLLNALAEPRCVDSARQIIATIERAVVDNPPLQIKEGNILKPGFNTELDQLRVLSTSGKTWIAQQEEKERVRTGIRSLKIGYNNVFGYYIEISNANKDAAPADYIRKQTLTNAERYITPELKEKETDILNAAAKMEKLEYQLFTELRQQIGGNIAVLQEIAQAVATLDTLLALAQAAVTHRYTRPRILDANNGSLHIVNGRHPVVEATLSAGGFIPNDCLFSLDQQRFMLLFGPNMSGKSTYMRQTALLILLAQMGSFVPAERMEFELIDRLFTRVGAMDDLFSGKSTFMVEMSETAHILMNATKRSFIILDEVGRGTSTYDGMAIAWAIAEYIHHTVGAKTIFATHYHELTQLAAQNKEIKNYNVAVEETNGDIVFLHKVVPGPANGSYGVHVAALAGIPKQIIDRANQLLETMENPENLMGKEQIPLL